jgi:REP element-mobilizing transposase RayT
MTLSPIGIIAQSCWYEIPQHFPFVELGAFITMPNHIHGIVIINKQVIKMMDANVIMDANVETQNFASLQKPPQKPPQNPPPQNPPSPPPSPNPNKFGPQSQNLASIVRGYKIGVTKNARPIHSDFAWQPRFHDRVIRDDTEYQRINDYIENNAQNWENDKFFKPDEL